KSFSFEQAWLLNSSSRSADDVFKAPAFVLAERTALYNSNHISLVGLAVLIVRHELRALRDDSFVNGVLNATMHDNDNSLLHLRTGHDADLFLVMSRSFLLRLVCFLNLRDFSASVRLS